jgi:hypothetical protein
VPRNDKSLNIAAYLRADAMRFFPAILDGLPMASGHKKTPDALKGTGSLEIGSGRGI